MKKRPGKTCQSIIIIYGVNKRKITQTNKGLAPIVLLSPYDLMRLWLRLCPCKGLTNERGNFSVGASLYSKWDPPGRDTPQGGYHTHYTPHSNLIFNPNFPNTTPNQYLMLFSLVILLQMSPSDFQSRPPMQDSFPVFLCK